MSTNTIILGGGCFWCTEAIFQNIPGVTEVISGYSGGQTTNPLYDEICTGTTGHAEVVKITYDDTIDLNELLILFFKTHNPTTLNQQGADRGTQYRSVIFYSNQNQKDKAVEIIDKINKSEIYPDPIVTEVTELETFYPAENYHQNYYNKNTTSGYCNVVINPKLTKLKEILNKK